MDQRPNSSAIMVIGSDSHFCYLMRRYVNESHHAIVFSYLGDDAVELARNQSPVAIILDVDHPESQGWELLRLLKFNPFTNNIPVVLCSWQDEDQRGIDEGAEACLRKPILYNEFKEVLSFLGIDSCE